MREWGRVGRGRGGIVTRVRKKTCVQFVLTSLMKGKTSLRVVAVVTVYTSTAWIYVSVH